MNSTLTQNFEDFITQRLHAIEDRLSVDDYYQSQNSDLTDYLDKLKNTLNPEQKKLLDRIDYSYNAFFPAQHQRCAYRLGLLDGLSIANSL